MRTKTTRAFERYQRQEGGYTYDCVKLFQLHKAEPIKGEGDLLENKGWYNRRASDLLDGAKEMARLTQHMRKKTDPDYRAGRLEISDWMLAEPDPVVRALLEMGYVRVEQAHLTGQGYRFYKEAA